MITAKEAIEYTKEPGLSKKSELRYIQQCIIDNATSGRHCFYYYLYNDSYEDYLVNSLKEAGFKVIIEQSPYDSSGKRFRIYWNED